MIKCVNENCDKNPIDSIDYTIVGIDGDAACSKYCKREYENNSNS